MAKKSNASVGMNMDYQAEDDMRTLARAEEIKKDAKRYKAALAMAKQKIADMQAIAGEAKEEKAEK